MNPAKVYVVRMGWWDKWDVFTLDNHSVFLSESDAEAWAEKLRSHEERVCDLETIVTVDEYELLPEIPQLWTEALETLEVSLK